MENREECDFEKAVYIYSSAADVNPLALYFIRGMLAVRR